MTGTGLHPWPWKAAVLLFLTCLLLTGKKLDFHGYVHDDEPNKVTQITQDKYNFNHPLLMLHSVKLYAQATGIADDYDRVIRAGRWSSVIFSALAVALLVLVSGRLHGSLVGTAAGIFALTTPLFFELAHYFKEDPALIFGLSLSLVAMQIYCERPSRARVAMLGAACGVAISAKYPGLMIMPFAVYAVLSAKRGKDLLVLAAFAAGAFCLINWPMIISPEIWKSRVDLEVSRLQAEGVPNRRQVPHGIYFSVLGKHASPFILSLLGLYGWSVWRRKFHLSAAEWTLLLMPSIYLLLISFIPTKSDRYALPASVLLACVAAAGLVPLAGWRHGKLLAVTACIGAVAWQVPKLVAEDAAFSSRRHEEVTDFMRSQLPPASAVLVDNYNSLGVPDYPEPKIKERQFQPGETLESLKMAGFSHVLVTAERYPVFAPESRRASGLKKEDEEKMRDLYNDIFNRCRLVSRWEAGNKKMLQPEFRLYELPQ